MKWKNISIVAMLAMLICSMMAIADTEQTTVTFVIPSQIDHSVAYGGACSSANFYYVETDATKDGNMEAINVTSDDAGTLACQTAAIAAITLNNLGSVNVNIVANMTAAYPDGVVLKAASAAAGYETVCSGTVAAGTCAYIINGVGVTLVAGLTAQTGTEEIWIWGNFSNFNAGVATTGIARTLETTAAAS